MSGKRECGVLLPISSLPSKYGIGCFSKSAYEFVDALKAAGQSCWQILPLGPTSYGDSPYQSFSTFAGNPYFISLEDLIEEGVLTKKECDAADFGADPSSVDYAKIYQSRTGLLRKAYERSPGIFIILWEIYRKGRGKGYGQVQGFKGSFRIRYLSGRAGRLD